MKKFAFLLAIVAVFAMSACAWAWDDGDLEAKVTGMKADDDHTALNNGISSGTGTAFSTKVYYIGEGAAFKVGGKFSTEAPNSAFGTNAKLAGFAGSDLKTFTATIGTGSDALSDVQFSLDAIPFATGSITGLGVYEVNNSEPASAAAGTATYTFNKTLVGFSATPITRQFKNGTAISGAEATIAVPLSTAGIKDATFNTALEAFNGTTKIDAAVDGMTFTPSKTGVAISGTPTKSGKYTITLKTAAENETLTITETKLEAAGADVEDIAVAGKIADKGTVVATIEITVIDYEITPASGDWDGNATPPPSVKFTVKGLTADKISKIEVKASGVGPDVLDKDSYTATTKGGDVEIELKLEYLEGLSKNNYTFTITGESSKTADFVLSVTPKAEKSYVATPASADWDGNKTAAGVKFKVDMPHSDFNAIGVEGPNDKDVRELGKDYYAVTPTAVGGIEVELKPDYLSKLTVSGDYVYSVGDKKGLGALFTLTVTPKKDTQTDVEATGKDLPDSLKDQLPDALQGKVEFGLPQVALDKDQIKELLGANIAASFDDESGKLTDTAARSIIGGSEKLTPLTAVKVEVKERGNIAPLTFKINPSWIVSSDIKEIEWSQAKIYKVYSDNDTNVTSVQLAPARTMADVDDGRFQIFKTGTTTLADKIKHNENAQYDLVVYVADQGKYDLERNPKVIVDPIVPAQATESGGGRHGSSGCDMGAGLAALTALAVLVTRMRKRK